MRQFESPGSSTLRRCAAALIVLLAAPALLFAQGTAPRDDDGAPHGRWWKNPRVVERLGLTESQVESISEIAFETGQQMIDLRANQEKAHLALQRQLENDQPDSSGVERALGNLETVKCEIARLEVRSRTRIALVLDRDQRVALLERFEQFERKRGDRAPMMDRRRMRRDAPPRDGGR